MFQFEAIGTRWTIDADIREQTLYSIKERIEAFDKTYSRFREDSLVMRISREAGVFEFPEDAQPMFALYKDLYNLTGGAMTPLIGQVLKDAGYDEKYSLIERTLSLPPSWDEVMSWDGKTLTTKQPVLLDFGAAGKGYLIDLIGELLEKAGVIEYTINAGGDIRHRSNTETPIRVGLEHPEHFDQVIGVATILNESICGSAGNRRRWGRFHHIIDPLALASPNHILALWVVAESTLLADALSTALFFVPPERLISRYPFEYLLVFPDHSFQQSKGFRAEMFT